MKKSTGMILVLAVFLIASCGNENKENEAFADQLYEAMEVQREAADALCSCLNEGYSCEELDTAYEKATSDYAKLWESREDLFDVLGSERKRTFFSEERTILRSVKSCRRNAGRR